MTDGGLSARSPVRQVISIAAIGNNGITFGIGDSEKFQKELVLTIKAAICRVPCKVEIVEFRGSDDAVRYADQRSHLLGVPEFAFRHGFG